MATLNVPIRIKRGDGLPTQLRQGELAFDQQNTKLYIGSGTEVGGYAPNVVELTTPPTVLEDLGNVSVGNGASDGDVLVYSFSSSAWVAQALAAASVAWGDITGKPTEFDPVAHKTSHATGGTDALSPSDIGAAAATHSHAWGDITSGVPSTFTPAAHNHNVTLEISGFIESPEAKTYVISPAIPAAITITNVKAKTSEGTVDIKLQDDGVDIADTTIGDVGTSVSSPASEPSAAVASGSVLALVVSDLQSSPADLAFSVHYTVASANNA